MTRLDQGRMSPALTAAGALIAAGLANVLYADQLGRGRVYLTYKAAPTADGGGGAPPRTPAQAAELAGRTS